MNESRAAGRYLSARIGLLGRKSASRLIRCEVSSDYAAARRTMAPCLLLSWHTGHLNALFSGLLRTNPDAAVLKSKLVHSDLDHYFAVYGTSSTGDDNAALINAVQLKQAADHVRRGGILLTFLDGTNGGTHQVVPFLDREVPLRQGAAALIRMTGASVFPCFGGWDSPSKEFVFRIGSRARIPTPVDGQDADQQCLTTLADLFSDLLRETPEAVTAQSSYLVRTSSTRPQTLESI